ncbi:GspH/FimT family pseudopilin [Gallaecimonas kandeliae]|uniref:GspH/FimT family pseudopilin n=1 Tax=Gallaecimonas kandeliae TaxID=3029055 RepID=UPI00264993A7|nr:GspH/FimT family pseudopilin [Gallaecimonas kandeliae]WKE67511.1 GspH/FimT family pseudopilin [Gallaecimonas kandeliae]
MELMVTLAVAAILITISYPSLTRFFKDNSLSTQASEIQSLLVTARHHALNYQLPVVVCPLTSGKCGSNWQGQLSVFVDSNGNGDQDSGEEVLATLEASSAQRVFSQNSVRYAADGILASSAGTIVLCDGNDASLYSGVIVEASGRSRVAEDSDHDGTKEDRNGNALKCN